MDCCSINSYNILSDSLDRVTPHGRHKGEIFCAGSTITADKYHLQLKPLHVKRKRNESMYTTFPRPYKNCIPGGTGHQIIFSDTYYNLLKEVEEIAIEFVLRHYFQSNRRKKVLHYINQCKKVCLWI